MHDGEFNRRRGYGGTAEEVDFDYGHRDSGFRHSYGGRGGPRGSSVAAGAQAERGPRQTGVVKFFNPEKGYGFITPDNGGPDVFVHISAVERSNVGVLDKGVRVSFETEPDKRGKGPKAVSLQAVDGVFADDSEHSDSSVELDQLD